MIPLTVLQGHLSALRDLAAKGQTPDPARLRQAIEETHYVGCIVHNLEAIARLESDDVHLELRRVDLADVVRRAVSRHAPIARGRDVALEHAVPPEPVAVRGDVTLLEQAVSNVVHNAVRYADPGGHVAVVLETPRGDAPTFRLRVLDDGPGVPPDELPHVTTRGFRGASARTRGPGGAGLGLAIVRDVLDRHAFSLALRGVEPHGLEVEVAGPLAAP
jgi:signal transduction histidine kinase